MPSLDQVLEFRKRMYEESTELIRRKGHDYNRKQQLSGDTLYNLRVAALMGIVETPEQGILVRLMDKMMRLSSLMTADVDAQVRDESVRDTVKDVHNYVDYALQMWEERRFGELKELREAIKPVEGLVTGTKVQSVISGPSFSPAFDEQGRNLGFVVDQKRTREPQAG